jgi:hypothetical protein
MRKFLFCLFVITLSLVFFNNADALCVKVPKANLREGPGTKFDLKRPGTFLNICPLRRLAQKGAGIKSRM